MKRLYLVLRIAAFVALIFPCLTGQTKKYAYTSRDKVFYADKALVDFVGPGLAITINSAHRTSWRTPTRWERAVPYAPLSARSSRLTGYAHNT